MEVTIEIELSVQMWELSQREKYINTTKEWKVFVLAPLAVQALKLLHSVLLCVSQKDNADRVARS